MRITRSDIIAGQPALTMRRLFLKGTGRLWGQPLVEQMLGVNAKTAKDIICQLLSEGYLARTGRQSDGHGLYENTVKGNALAMASAAAPVKRKRAQQKLEEFIERVKKVNEDEYFLYKVDTVVLFGSYLTVNELVNDIDLAIKLVPKIQDHEQFQELSRKRMREALDGGRSFSNIVEELGWPQLEVTRYLKARSRIISIHPIEDGVLESADSRVIYPTEPCIGE